MSFIPANESRFLVWFFDLYTRWLLSRRFKTIWVKQFYKPNKDSKSVYFINHNMWWDGLLPLFLSRNVFHQKARAIMEEKQMRNHRFFSKIGAFSINLTYSKSTLRTLRYAIDSMEIPNISLYIYPEGKFNAASESKPDFKQGLAWIYQNMDRQVDFVPISFYTHLFTDSKPELFINIGRPLILDKKRSKEFLTTSFEEAVHRLLLETREVAGFSNEGFTKS